MDKTPGLDAAYGLESLEDNLKLYAAWAASYDSDFADETGYLLPMHVARAYAKAGGQGPVLDLGAGTGLLGGALAMLGVGPVDATDISAEMLEVARAKGIYREAFTGNLLGRLPVPDGRYAGAVSSGTFTNGHVGPEALAEVLRVVQPGGLIALSINSVHWQRKGFEAAFAGLGAAVQGLERIEVPIYSAHPDPAHAQDRSQVVTFRKG